MTKFAITFTVANELSLLKENLEYHRGIGCVLFIIFLDNCADGTREYFSTCNDVLVLDSLEHAEKTVWPEQFKCLLPRISESYDVRKVLNTFIASEVCKKQRIEWLVSIDPDELVYLASNPRHFVDYLRNVPKDVDQILFRNIELAVDVDLNKGEEMLQAHLFKKRPPEPLLILLRFLNRLLRCIGVSPRLEGLVGALFMTPFYGARGRFTRLQCLTIGRPWFNGYVGYKSAIKVERAGSLIFSVHYWLSTSRRKCKSVKVDYLLHFDILGVNHFQKKFSTSLSLPSDSRFFFRRLLIMASKHRNGSFRKKVFTSLVSTDTSTRKVRRYCVKIDLEDFKTKSF